MGWWELGFTVFWDHEKKVRQQKYLVFRLGL